MISDKISCDSSVGQKCSQDISGVSN